MEITLENISKKYGSRWIFKNLSYKFSERGRYALIGPNGSGKSTLLSILVAKTPTTKGVTKYAKHGHHLSVENVYKEVSIASTAMAVIEEFTLEELVKFHFRFRAPASGLEKTEIFELLELDEEKHKLISNFSSGMKQRLKIGLALFSESSLVILDEPGANLDERSKEWFQDMLRKHLGKRTLIIASNDADDYQICDQFLNIAEFRN